MARHRPTLPLVTQADLDEAWASYSARLRGPNVPANLAQALAHRTHGPVLRAAAARLRKTRWQATAERTVDLVPAVRLGMDGHPLGWVTQQGSQWHAAPKINQLNLAL